MTIKELRIESKMTQKAFCEFLFNIPVRTLQDWENDRRKAPNYNIELIEYKLRNEIPHMKNYKGARWGCLSEIEKEFLLDSASPIDAITANKPRESGECIIDFVYPFSVAGYYKMRESEDEIIIDDNAIIYSSIE